MVALSICHCSLEPKAFATVRLNQVAPGLQLDNNSDDLNRTSTTQTRTEYVYKFHALTVTPQGVECAVGTVNASEVVFTLPTAP